MMNNDFAVFILTHGRPDNVMTFKTLKKAGYTGKIYFIIDNEDKTAEKYYENFGKENVIMFDKKAVSDTFDEFDNFENRKAIVYARNACFEIAKELGITYFIELDDDYTNFEYRLYLQNAIVESIKNLDNIFGILLNFYKSIKAKSIAFSQGGDFIGGLNNGKQLYRFSKRKCMNSFLCSTKRPFQFVGAINEDVNSYTTLGSKGELFFTIPFVSLTQAQTQSQKGGMTDIYIDGGTYKKSFYTVMTMPSSVTVKMMGETNKRLHHSIKWKNTVPLIIDQRHKKE